MNSRIVVLVSGGGTNLQALIDAEKNNAFAANIVAVISDNPQAYALERAKQHGAQALYIPKSSLRQCLNKELARLNADFVVLAGFLSIVPDDVVAAYRNRIVNIHPSLIPKYCGRGYYGIRVHQAVLAAGDDSSGATTHYVDEGIDTGKIIMQESVPVYAGDTPELLQQRVLAVEHRILVETIRKIIHSAELAGG